MTDFQLSMCFFVTTVLFNKLFLKLFMTKQSLLEKKNCFDRLKCSIWSNKTLKITTPSYYYTYSIYVTCSRRLGRLL